MDPLDYYGTPKTSFFDNIKGYALEIFETLVVFGAIFAAIYLFVAQFHKVSGNSMVPTFKSGDYLITEKVTYRFNSPKKGDIIVLKNPKDESEDFIKRIIALPGDTIKIENNIVYVNGEAIREKYLPPQTSTRAGSFLEEGGQITAGPNQYFVLGDNRNHSSDSREWGAITRQEIVGRALFRYWPPQNMGLLTDK